MNHPQMLRVSVKCIMKPNKTFFSYQFSQFPLESVWLALLCLGNDANTILRLLLGSTKHHRSYRNNGFHRSFSFDNWSFLAQFYFFLKIRLPQYINLNLYSSGQPIKNVRIQTEYF
jgi:hypothetical protein